jgi:hypothetical protein
MKTGRRRKKEKEPGEEQAEKPVSFRPPSGAPSEAPSRAPSRPGIVRLLPILIGLAVLVFGGLICSRACLGPRAEPSIYLPATAEGSWTATVRVVLPSEMQGYGGEDTERIVDEYDDYAYNIYYEETEDRLYEAAGDSFVVTQLNEKEDWWEGDLHYFSEEWLDKETCQYTNYTAWITDPEDEDYEIEVVLSECEVWDHVIVKERVSEEGGAPAGPDTFTRQGVGTAVEWPAAVAPVNGRLEREFEGVVTFRADGAERTVRVTDVDTYIRYLTIRHYLGLDEEGDVVDLTDKAP